MKLILTFCFAVIMPMLHPSADDSANNGSTIRSENTLKQVAEEPAAFKENKILVTEFTEIIKDYRGGLMNSNVEKQKVRVN